ncbi:hypothetical protein [Reichenbachiella sp. MALMAid0571]|uniref:hypothetical protein n=1 Tax=Reichenbachiella sp. MALMAid0571 TaxID=3143939 RepID=UPI0032DEA0A8
MESNKIDQLFREKLASGTSTPDPQAWNDLEALLDKKKKKATFWYFKIAVSILLILACGLVTYQIFSGEEEVMSIVQVDIDYREMETQQNDIVELDKNAIKPPELPTDVNIEQLDIPDILKNETLALGSEEQNSDSIEEHKKDNSRFLEADEDIVPDLMLVDLQEENGLDDLLVEAEEEQKIETRKHSKSVTITYKVSKKKVNPHRVVIIAKLDTTKRRRPDLRDILRFPGHLLADVRDAKDYIFNPKSDMNKTKSEN